MCVKLIYRHFSCVLEVHDDRHVVRKTLIRHVAEVAYSLDLSVGISVVDVDDLVNDLAVLSSRADDVGA